MHGGYAALTIDGVALRAGVHKTTIYRRWSDRETLVVDALTDWAATDVPTPDTGTVENDLRALARSVMDLLTGSFGRAVLITMISAADRVPEIVDARRRFFAERLRQAAPIVTRGIERGELPPGTDAAELIKALTAPIYLRLLATEDLLDDSVALRAADAALTAAQAGVFCSPPAGRPSTAGPAAV